MLVDIITTKHVRVPRQTMVNFINVEISLALVHGTSLWISYSHSCNESLDQMWNGMMGWKTNLMRMEYLMAWEDESDDGIFDGTLEWEDGGCEWGWNERILYEKYVQRPTVIQDHSSIDRISVCFLHTQTPWMDQSRISLNTEGTGR